MNATMMELYLHGYGSDASEFRSHWPPAGGDQSRVFLNGPEFDRLTGRRRWFPLSGQEPSIAKGLAAATSFAEASIPKLIQIEGHASDVALTLVGHSQGGSVALALAARGTLNVRLVEAFACFLPSGFLPPTTPSARPGAVPGEVLEVRMHYSIADRFVAASDVERTARMLRLWVQARVVLCCSPTLIHEFSSAWLDPANFLDPVEVA